MAFSVKDLTKSYNGRVVVDHLNFEMPGPGVYALLGTNGAGKTTSIRMMLNMLARDEGEVLWNGKPLSVDTCNIGYLAEERGLYPKYRLLDQLRYFATLRGVSSAEADKRIRQLADQLRVNEYLWPEKAAKKSLLGGKSAGGVGSSMRAEQLSKGNQQKIQLMIALISDPELIVLDEPMSGLDPVNTDLFRDIIRGEIQKGKTIIMSSHQMATVEEFCTDITILHRSKTVLQGNLNAIKKERGRTNLHLKCEQDPAELIERAGITVLERLENDYELRVTGTKQANELLAVLTAQGIGVVTFDLREPTLHEIFVEKAGEGDAQE